ncbi:MAG: hypothetical protein GY721_13680, partial [Deltaproteobacteria bacterium]|nr:hypothetical protein [Deltaproteobacteria bacterium]
MSEAENLARMYGKGKGENIPSSDIHTSIVPAKASAAIPPAQPEGVIQLLHYRGEGGRAMVSDHFHMVNHLLLRGAIPNEDMEKIVGILSEANILCLSHLMAEEDSIQGRDDSENENFIGHILRFAILDLSRAGWSLRHRVTNNEDLSASNQEPSSGSATKGKSIPRSRERSERARDSRGRSYPRRRRSRRRSRSRRGVDIPKIISAVRGEELSADEEQVEHEIQKVHALISKNCRGLQAEYIPPPKTVLPMVEGMRRAPIHNVTKKPMYISPYPPDEKRWVPAYVGANLSPSDRRSAVSELEEDKGPTATLIQQALSYLMAHVVVGAISHQDALMCAATLIQISIDKGRVVCYHYFRTLTFNIRTSIQSGEDVNVGERLSRKEETLILSSREDVEKHKKEKERKEKEKEREKERNRRDRERDRPPIPRAQRSQKGYPKGGHAETSRTGTISGVDRSKDSKHVCLYHDIRQGKKCQERACRRIHLDTSK